MTEERLAEISYDSDPLDTEDLLDKLRSLWGEDISTVFLVEKVGNDPKRGRKVVASSPDNVVYDLGGTDEYTQIWTMQNSRVVCFLYTKDHPEGEGYLAVPVNPSNIEKAVDVVSRLHLGDVRRCRYEYVTLVDGLVMASTNGTWMLLQSLDMLTR